MKKRKKFVFFFSFQMWNYLSLNFQSVFFRVWFFCDSFLLENLGQNWLSISKCLQKTYSLILKNHALFNAYFGSCSSNLKFDRVESTQPILLSMWKYAPIWSVRKFWEITGHYRSHSQIWQAELSEVSVKTLWALNAVQLLMSSAWGVTEHPGPLYILCHQLAGFQQTHTQVK